MKGVKIFLKLVFWLSLATAVVTFFLRENLPEPMELLPEIHGLPIMTETEKDDFSITSEDSKANLVTRKDYELSGLVVADYDSENWLDWTHRYDPFNTKDLCLLWGDNARVATFADYKFWHGEFTCFFKPKEWPLTEELNHQHVSNNHFLPANEAVYQAIKKSRPGDQIYFKGILVDYQIETADFSTGYRYSSVNPFDNHCEVIYTEDFQILQIGNRLERGLFKFSIYSLVGSLLLMIIIFLIEMQLRWKIKD